MEKKIYFDMDGTFYNLYGYNGWLECILSEHTECYTKGTMLIDYDKFVTILSELKENGYTIGIITWLSKNATRRYQNMVRNAKIRYIRKNFGDIFDEMHVIQYGKNKNQYAENGYILFDDEMPNRIEWEKKNGVSYDVTNIIEILENLLTK